MLKILGNQEIIKDGEQFGILKAAPISLIELETINIVFDGSKTTMQKIVDIIEKYDEEQETNIEWDEPIETEKEYCKRMKLNVVEKERSVEELRSFYIETKYKKYL